MSLEVAMALTNRLLSQAQALAAVTAYLRLSAESARADPELHAWLERVVDALEVRDALAALSEHECAIVAAFARSYLHQALELVDHPSRPNAWTHSDPTILQAQGSASAIVAKLIDGAGLCAPDARILDVGTGVAGLAIAFCHTFPSSTVVGIDPWEPALKLARENVAKEGMESRITLRQVRLQDFHDDDGFDLIWLPSFFIPDAVLDDAFARSREILRPEGCLVVGVVEGPDEPLAAAVDAMITVRSGGAVMKAEEAISRLEKTGFDDVREATRTWAAPVRLIVARDRERT